MVACRAHDSTLSVNHDRASTVAVGVAYATVDGGCAALVKSRCAWTNSWVAARAKCRNAFDSSSDWLVGHGVADMGLAFTSDVSIGAGSSSVARGGAHVFSVGRNFILVERGGAVSLAKPLAAYCHAFVLAQRGCGQHHCRGHTCIFARRYLPMVRINGANFWCLSAHRSARSRGNHVGSWTVGVFNSRSGHSVQRALQHALATRATI